MVSWDSNRSKNMECHWSRHLLKDIIFDRHILATFCDLVVSLLSFLYTCIRSHIPRPIQKVYKLSVIHALRQVHNVSYSDMVSRRWKPLPQFYDNTYAIEKNRKSCTLHQSSQIVHFYFHSQLTHSVPFVTLCFHEVVFIWRILIGPRVTKLGP